MYKLNKLNYKINDLNLDDRTIKIQQIIEETYLNNLNELLIKNNYNFRYPIEDLVNHLDIFSIDDRGDILYNLGGVLNHELYFNSISPYNKNVPVGKLSNAINNKYGSFLNFKNIFINKALSVVGSGYTYLVLDRNNNLNIISMTNEETPYSYGYKPLIAIDLWEHAYIFYYNINKKKYIEDFFKLIDFEEINKLYINITNNRR